MFNVLLGYPSPEEEIEIVKRTTGINLYQVRQVFSREDIILYQELVRKIPVSDEVLKYAVNIVNKTRPESDGCPPFVKDYIRWGAGPRASQYLILASKAVSAIDGKYAASMDDVKSAVHAVLRHRLILNFNAEADNVRIDDLISRLLE
jgi:MoxR-like ATPase